MANVLFGHFLYLLNNFKNLVFEWSIKVSIWSFRLKLNFFVWLLRLLMRSVCLRIHVVHVLTNNLLCSSCDFIILLLDHLFGYEYLFIKHGRHLPFLLWSYMVGLQAIDADKHAVEVNHRWDHKPVYNEILRREELLPHVTQQDYCWSENQLISEVCFYFMLPKA